MAPHRTGPVADARFDPDHGIEDATRLIIVEPPRVGQRHGPRRPREQRAPEAFLKQFDLAAQKGRRDAKILGRARKAAALDDAAEGLHDGKLVHALEPGWLPSDPQKTALRQD